MSKHGTGVYQLCFTDDGVWVAFAKGLSGETKETAEYAATACNAHDELLRELKWCLDFLRKGFQHPYEPTVCGTYDMDRIRASIAKAEGTE